MSVHADAVYPPDVVSTSRRVVLASGAPFGSAAAMTGPEAR